MKWICLKEEFRHHGYMTEAVKVITEWALSQENVKQVEAETDAGNIASQKVLFRSGFISNGKMGEEGPRFVAWRGSRLLNSLSIQKWRNNHEN